MRSLILTLFILFGYCMQAQNIVHPEPGDSLFPVTSRTRDAQYSFFENRVEEINTVVNGLAKLDLGGLPQGIYYLRTSFNGIPHFEKLVLQR